ncbi:radical SAM protein [Desulfatirhabdium butyrativorans]|uniref:radical SAM protein n=1 Tax=Desulfatirhabdium butyrativorans TaxID=340467 RepID=UPI0004017071|nr:radical SAM protein [Desulfatirhabdium butyrativorans]
MESESGGNHSAQPECGVSEDAKPSRSGIRESSILQDRAAEAIERLSACDLCPRQCGVNRAKGETGFCRTGRHAWVSDADAHFGEEDPLVGTGGSGTIFFTNCNLGCNFCQNYEISHLGAGRKVGPEELADIMLSLHDKGCHNINFVTPSHVVAQILEALVLAAGKGLRIPLIYNTSAYDRTDTLALLDGIIDIYMPDFKFWDPEVARLTCNAPDYPRIAAEAIREMHRQVGDLALDRNGIAVRGLLVRHLVLPENLAGTDRIMAFLAQEISAETYTNVMNQYRPCGTASKIPALSRKITPAEYEAAIDMARKAGIRRLDRRRRKFALWI